MGARALRTERRVRRRRRSRNRGLDDCLRTACDRRAPARLRLRHALCPPAPRAGFADLDRRDARAIDLGRTRRPSGAHRQGPSCGSMHERGLMFGLTQLVVADFDGTPLALAPEARVRLSVSALKRGRIAIEEVELLAPRLNVTYDPDGTLALSFQRQADAQEPQATAHTGAATGNRTRRRNAQHRSRPRHRAGFEPGPPPRDRHRLPAPHRGEQCRRRPCPGTAPHRAQRARHAVRSRPPPRPQPDVRKGDGRLAHRPSDARVLAPTRPRIPITSSSTSPSAD